MIANVMTDVVMDVVMDVVHVVQTNILLLHGLILRQQIIRTSSLLVALIHMVTAMAMATIHVATVEIIIREILPLISPPIVPTTVTIVIAAVASILLSGCYTRTLAYLKTCMEEYVAFVWAHMYYDKPIRVVIHVLTSYHYPG